MTTEILFDEEERRFEEAQHALEKGTYGLCVGLRHDDPARPAQGGPGGGALPQLPARVRGRPPASPRTGSRRVGQDARDRRRRLRRLARRAPARGAGRRPAPDGAADARARTTWPGSTTRPCDCDILDRRSVRRALKGVDRVFHVRRPRVAAAARQRAPLRGQRGGHAHCCSRSACARASSASSTPRARRRSARRRAGQDRRTSASSSPPATSASRT